VVKEKDQHNSQKNREGNKQANHELSDLPRILSTLASVTFVLSIPMLMLFPEKTVVGQDGSLQKYLK